jgi:hypothetical protein
MLYYISPARVMGIYSFVEVGVDAGFRPKKTIFCYEKSELPADSNNRLTKPYIATSELLAKKGIIFPLFRNGILVERDSLEDLKKLFSPKTQLHKRNDEFLTYKEDSESYLINEIQIP